MSTIFNKVRIYNNSGFTLIELMLSMTLFISVMLVATAGFVGINRTFTKGIVRKNLSEGVQRISDDVTRVIRDSGGKVALDQNGGQFSSLCGSTTCFLWGANSLYRVPNNIDKRLGSGQELLDKRFKVDLLEIKPVGTSNDLYRVSGIVRTTNPDPNTDKDSFNFPEGYPSATKDSQGITCKGSAVNVSRNCAFEKFNFVVHVTGGQP